MARVLGEWRPNLLRPVRARREPPVVGPALGRDGDWLSVGLVCPYSFSRPGGVQNHVLGLAGWLRRQGHVVTVIGPGHPGRDALAHHGLPTSSFTSTGPTVPVTINGSVARLDFSVRALMRVRAWLDSQHFDVLHVHEPLTPSSSLLTLWNADRPLVGTFHASSRETTLLKVARQLAPGTVARIDEAVAVSQAAAEVARRYWRLDPVIIGNGVDTAPLVRARRRPHPWRAGEHPRLTFLGRFEEPRKGFSTFRSVVSAVRTVHPDLEAVVVGPGQPSAEDHDLRFLGPLDDEARNEVLGATDVYLAPATGGESFGIVLVEAMAAGAAVVASDLPGFREVVTDDRGVIGWLTPPGEVDAMVEAVLAALRGEGEDLSGRGLARSAQFDWDGVGPRLVEQYRLAATRRSERRGVTSPTVEA